MSAEPPTQIAVEELRSAVEKLQAAWESLAEIETYCKALVANDRQSRRVGFTPAARKALLDQQFLAVKQLRRDLTEFLSKLNEAGRAASVKGG